MKDFLIILASVAAYYALVALVILPLAIAWGIILTLSPLFGPVRAIWRRGRLFIHNRRG